MSPTSLQKAQTSLDALIERLEKQEGPSNELDIACEIALFNPDVAIRSNAAGTKVIYTKRNGAEATHWAADWTMDMPRTLSLLRALQSEGRDAGL